VPAAIATKITINRSIIAPPRASRSIALTLSARLDPKEFDRLLGQRSDRRGASVFKMRDVSRHKSMDVLQAYVRDADPFRDHVARAYCRHEPAKLRT
jgi:hypothetical protein